MQYRRMKDGTAKSIAMTIAMAVFTAMDGFRRRNLNDAQVREFVPILCNAIYTAYYCDRHRAKDWYCDMQFRFAYRLLPDYWEPPELLIHSEIATLVRDKDLLDQLALGAKIYAMIVRNAIEDFHCMYLSDAQMQELNPIVRNAIYTALYCMVNYGDSECRRWLSETEDAIPDDWPEPVLLSKKPRGGKAVLLKKSYEWLYLGKERE